MSDSEKTDLKSIVQSEFFREFTKYTQADFGIRKKIIRFVLQEILMMHRKIL
jgi:hypothetical protein